MNDLLWSKMRLTIVGQLLEMEWMPFGDLLDATHATFGNLGSHLAKLIAARYVEDDKRIVGRKVQTRYRLTPLGRNAFVEHISELEGLIGALRREHYELPRVVLENPPTTTSARTMPKICPDI